MATEIRVWQIEDEELTPLETTMAEAGRTESEDLERWIRSNPSILGQDILMIGEQVQTKSGPLDFLGIDRSGNAVIVELKRDRIPREALTQAIDYASDVATWDFDRLSEECAKYADQSLDEYISESFEDVDSQDISVNQMQGVLLVGTYVEESLQRMVEWLSGNYGLGINAVIFRYIRTKSGDELLARTMIIPEEVEKERSEKQKRRIPMSDEPGSYGDDELRTRLKRYLSREGKVPRRLREILLPLCLEHDLVKRDEIKKQLVKRKETTDWAKAGMMASSISTQLGLPQYDYLRQVIRYEKPEATPWQKENFRIEGKYKGMIRELLGELGVGTKDIGV